jgi:hypothetical protein
MLIKKRALILLITWAMSFSVSHSQKISAVSSNQVPFAASKLGSVRGCAGIFDDSYYILENDYGGPRDFKNNITTYITCFSISQGKIKFRLNLNEILAESKKELDKILFYDVITWKGKLIAFYTHKNASASDFPVIAAIFDSNGKLIKSAIEMGIIPHKDASGTFLNQGGLIVNGRNTLSVIHELKFKITPDSSKLAMYVTPEGKEGNIKVLIYDPNLNLVQTVVSALPFDTKTADLYEFAFDNNGLLYFLTKANLSKSGKKNEKDDDGVFQLHQINTGANNTIKSFPIVVSDKIVNQAGIFLKNDNELYCFGTYHDAGDKKTNGRTTGAFSAFLKTGANKFVTSQFDISEPNRVSMEPYEKKKAKDGLLHDFALQNAFPDNNGGMYVVMNADIIKVTVRGSTGAMNSYEEQTFSNIYFYISKDKKIKWLTGTTDFAKNAEMATRIDRTLYYVRSDQFNFVFIAKGMIGNESTSLYETHFDGNGNFKGNTRIISQISPALGDVHTVDNTLYRLADNEFIFTTASGQLGFFKFKIE